MNQYWVDLKNEAEDKLIILDNELKILYNKRKNFWIENLSKDKDNLNLKEEYSNITKLIDDVYRKFLIASGQLTILKKVVNFEYQIEIGTYKII